jgi:hypothetical protein
MNIHASPLNSPKMQSLRLEGSKQENVGQEEKLKGRQGEVT